MPNFLPHYPVKWFSLNYLTYLVLFTMVILSLNLRHDSINGSPLKWRNHYILGPLQFRIYVAPIRSIISQCIAVFYHIYIC